VNDGACVRRLTIVRKNRQGRLGVVTTRIDGRLRYLPIDRDERF
jgi:hypothetical protein